MAVAKGRNPLRRAPGGVKHVAQAGVGAERQHQRVEHRLALGRLGDADVVFGHRRTSGLGRRQAGGRLRSQVGCERAEGGESRTWTAAGRQRPRTAKATTANPAATTRASSTRPLRVWPKRAIARLRAARVR